MNEIVKEQNKKDLKLYRRIIACVVALSIFIGGFVTLVTGNIVQKSATVSNFLISIFMPRSITAQDDDTVDNITGMKFYREKNKEYNPEKDDPVKAFNYYYYIDDDKIYLKDGMYYTPDYYNEKKDVPPVYVYVGFYLEAAQTYNLVKKIVKIVFAVLCVAAFFGLIYLWYRSWLKRELAKKDRNKELQ